MRPSTKVEKRILESRDCLLLTYVTLVLKIAWLRERQHSTNIHFKKSNTAWVFALVLRFLKAEHFQFALKLIKSLSLQTHREI